MAVDDVDVNEMFDAADLVTEIYLKMRNVDEERAFDLTALTLRYFWQDLIEPEYDEDVPF